MIFTKYFKVQDFLYKNLILPAKNIWFLILMVIFGLFYLLPEIGINIYSVFSAIAGAVIVAFLGNHVRSGTEKLVRIKEEVKEGRLILCLMLSHFNFLQNIKAKFLVAPHTRLKPFLVNDPEYIQLKELVCFMEDPKFVEKFDIIKSNQKSLSFLIEIISDRNAVIEDLIRSANVRTKEGIGRQSMPEAMNEHDHDELYNQIPDYMKKELDGYEETISNKINELIIRQKDDFANIQEYFDSRYPNYEMSSTKYTLLS